MKTNILSILAAGLIAGACGDLTSINENPNGPVDVPPPAIISTAIQNVSVNVNGVGPLNIRGGGLWAQYYSEIQYRDEDKYIVRSGTSGGWTMYNGALEDFQRMIDKGVAASTPNWEAVGRIMKSYTFSVLTEAMGDVPYTQALQGNTVLAPKYDTQQSIYNALFVDLAKANTLVDPTGIGFSGGDLLYGGNMAEWKMFANSLRLRLALHLSNVDAVKGKAEALAAIAAGVFQANSDNARLLYLATSPNRNPIYNDAIGRDDYGMSKTYVDSLLSWADPRLPVFAQLNKEAVPKYAGLPNGLNDGEGPPLSTISRFGAYWRSTPGAPMSLLTYSEVLFLQAEAAQRGWTAGNAATLYNAAITASMQQYGIAAPAIATYLADPRVVYVAGTGLTQIAYQKWVSMFMQGMESWTEVRRTRVPLLIPGPRAVFGAGVAGKIPERLPYDDQELVLNNANVTAAVAAQKFGASNAIDKPLWFTGRQ